MTARATDGVDSGAAYAEALDQWYRRAANVGFPLFVTDVEQSSPLNASPYVTDRAGLTAATGGSATRDRLLQQLDRLIAQLETMAIDCRLLMIGGSLLDLQTETPNDIDALIFYVATGQADDCGMDIGAVARSAKDDGADVRLVPIDSDPMILIKMVSYFTSLYSMAKDGGRNARGVVLVDLR